MPDPQDTSRLAPPPKPTAAVAPPAPALLPSTNAPLPPTAEEEERRRREELEAARVAQGKNPGEDVDFGAQGPRVSGDPDTVHHEIVFGRPAVQRQAQEDRQLVADESAFDNITGYTGGPGTMDTTVGTVDPMAGGAGFDAERFDVQAPQHTAAQVAQVDPMTGAIIDPAAAAGLQGFAAAGQGPSQAQAMMRGAADAGQRALLAQTANVRGGAAMQAAGYMGAQAEAARAGSAAAAGLGQLAAQETAQRRTEELQALEGVAGLAETQAGFEQGAEAQTHALAGESALAEAGYEQESGVVNIESHHRTADRVLDGLKASGRLAIDEGIFRQNAERMRQDAATKGEEFRLVYEQYERAVENEDFDKAMQIAMAVAGGGERVAEAVFSYGGSEA